MNEKNESVIKQKCEQVEIIIFKRFPLATMNNISSNSGSSKQQQQVSKLSGEREFIAF